MLLNQYSYVSLCEDYISKKIITKHGIRYKSILQLGCVNLIELVMENRKVLPHRNHREIPPFCNIKHDLNIPNEARFIGWYINRTKNPHQFVSEKYEDKTIPTRSLITVDIEKAKHFKLGQFHQALEFVDQLPFAATLSVIFGYVKVADSIPATTINRAVIDKDSTEYLVFSAMALYDNKKPEFNDAE